jgi:DNA-binding LytR/AlgR family response regulator
MVQEQISGYEIFTLATNQGLLVFQQTSILRLEASNNYTIFHIQNQNPEIASYSIADFEVRLHPEKFIRVHKSHIVNIEHISKYSKGDGGMITMKDGSEIPVSRSRKAKLLKKLLPFNKFSVVHETNTVIHEI